MWRKINCLVHGLNSDNPTNKLNKQKDFYNTIIYYLISCYFLPFIFPLEPEILKNHSTTLEEGLKPKTLRPKMPTCCNIQPSRLQQFISHTEESENPITYEKIPKRKSEKKRSNLELDFLRLNECQDKVEACYRELPDIKR